MNIRQTFRRIFWSGPRCSRCGRALKQVEGGFEIIKGAYPCTVYRCTNCGALICEFCQGFGFGLMQGCKCGGHEYEVFQMWAI